MISSIPQVSERFLDTTFSSSFNGFRGENKVFENYRLSAICAAASLSLFYSQFFYEMFLSKRAHTSLRRKIPTTCWSSRKELHNVFGKLKGVSSAVILFSSWESFVEVKVIYTKSWRGKNVYKVDRFPI